MTNKILKLFGNDFNEKQIIQWFKEEEEAYAKLEGENVTIDSFTYNNPKNKI